MGFLNSLNETFFSIHKKFNKLKLINEKNFTNIIDSYKNNVKYEEWCCFMSTLVKTINTVPHFLSEMKLCHHNIKYIEKKLK